MRAILPCLLSLIGVAAAVSTAAIAAEQQLIEVRLYHLRSAEKADQFDRMMKNVGIAALKRAGVGPVGVLQPVTQEGDEVLRVVILPFESPEAFAALSDRLVAEPEIWEAAQDYLLQDKSDPAYTRIEASLLKAFRGMPRLEVPSGGPARLFELRVYESFSEVKGKLKIEMFNDGEIELFKKVGLHAVFYGEALVAANLPNLTYLVVHENEAEQKAAWDRFLAHPDWDRLKTTERYQDTVSKIIKQMLVATDYSEIK